MTAAETSRWWLHFVARAVTTRAQLVVRRALLRIAQRFVGLVDGLELLLGARFLADIGVVLAREATVRALDFSFAGAGLQAQRFVVILELHVPSALA